MKQFVRAAVVVASTGALSMTLAVPGTPAAAAEGVRVVATGLGGPLHVARGPEGRVLVAEAFAGKISKVNPRNGSVSRVASHRDAFTAGVAARGENVFYTLSRESESGPGLAVLMRKDSEGEVRRVANLLAFELKHNPDGQPLGVDDADSNPYAVLALPGRVLVADAAGNDIVEVRSNGRMRALTVFPVSRKGECATRPNNGVANGGCDPTPTDLKLGPDGYLYVSGLGGEAEGHIWKVNAKSGRIVEHWDGLPPLTGIEVRGSGDDDDDDITLYASSLFTNQVFRIDDDDDIDVAEVPSPAGLAFVRGTLYVASPSFEGPGSVLAISRRAFR